MRLDWSFGNNKRTIQRVVQILPLHLFVFRIEAPYWSRSWALFVYVILGFQQLVLACCWLWSIYSTNKSVLEGEAIFWLQVLFSILSVMFYLPMTRD